MKKFILILIVILILVGGIFPYVDGLLFKRNYFQLVEAWNLESKSHIKINEYRVGWFKSYAKVVIESKEGTRSLDLKSYVPSTILLDQTISHGPFIFDTRHTRLRMAAALIESKIYVESLNAIFDLPQTESLFFVSTIATFGNNYYSIFSIPAIIKHFPNGISMDWKGLKGVSDLFFGNDRINRITTSITSGALNAGTPNDMYGLKVASYHSKSDATASALPRLWNVDHTSTVSGFSTFLLGKPFFSIDNLEMLTKTKVVDSKSYYSSVNVSLNKFKYHEFVISPASLNITIENIDAEALLRIINLSLAERQKAYELYPSLITAATFMKVDLSINASNGLLTITSEMHFPKDALPKTMADIKQNAELQVDFRIGSGLLFDLVNLLDGSGQSNNLSLSPGSPQTTVTIKQQVDTLISQGYLIQDKTDYISSIVVSQGKIMVNGKPYPMIVTPPGPAIPSTVNPTPQTAPTATSAPSVSTPSPQPVAPPIVIPPTIPAR